MNDREFEACQQHRFRQKEKGERMGSYMKISILTVLAVALLLFNFAGSTIAAQQVTGELGSPSATTAVPPDRQAQQADD